MSYMTQTMNNIIKFNKQTLRQRCQALDVINAPLNEIPCVAVSGAVLSQCPSNSLAQPSSSPSVYYTRFRLYGLWICGLFGYLVNFWVVPISLSLVKFLGIRANSGQFWLYGQMVSQCGPYIRNRVYVQKYEPSHNALSLRSEQKE